MSHRTLAILAIPALLFVGALTGCRSTSSEVKSVPVISQKGDMTLDQAKFIIEEALQNPPVGRRPSNPGFEVLAKETKGVRTRPNNRGGNCLVEVMGEKKAILKFYTRTEDDANKFTAALARIKAEYAE
ncbi:MAG: hypothetical protein J5944_10175 [Lentisphaeria bacterium]|nr:hypothetical protein [Lentisphaeria bacterium]